MDFDMLVLCPQLHASQLRWSIPKGDNSWLWNFTLLLFNNWVELLFRGLLMLRSIQTFLLWPYNAHSDEICDHLRNLNELYWKDYYFFVEHFTLIRGPETQNQWLHARCCPCFRSSKWEFLCLNSCTWL